MGMENWWTEADAFLALRISHPAATARELLDVVFGENPGGTIDSNIDPRTPFGPLVAEAFDHRMVAADWLVLDHIEEPAQEAMLRIWRGEVLPRFLGAYRSHGCGLTPRSPLRRGSSGVALLL